MKESFESLLPGALFVGGADTGVGKTLVCGCLLTFLHGKGIHAGYQKWVSTGGSEYSEDEALCRQMAPNAFLEGSVLHVPYRFSLPASPHLAAEADGGAVNAAILEKSFLQLQQHFRPLIVEGVGGMLVPLSRQLLLADLVAELGLPALLVCRSGLGTINHTLLSVEACKKRGIPLKGLIFSDGERLADERLVADNMEIIAALSGVPVLGRLPHAPNSQAAVESFAPIGEALLERLAETKTPPRRESGFQQRHQ